MYFSRRILILLTLAGLLLSSCGGQKDVSPTQDLNAMLTAAVGTVVESVMQTQSALLPPATSSPSNTPLPVPTGSPVIQAPQANLPTATLIYLNATLPVLATPTVTGTRYTPTVNPSTLAFGCNNMLFIRDTTVPAGTVFVPKEKFTKIWQVANIGTCDWVYLYHLVFTGGEAMGGKPDNLSKVIKPGNWTKLSVDLTAPSKPGTYTGYWRFGDQTGNLFGSTLVVSIVVATPTKTPTPTSTFTPSPTTPPYP